MTFAFVLINSELGMEKDLLDELKGIENVKEAYYLYGLYDVIAKVEASTMEDVKETINGKIRHLRYIKSTLTLIAM